MADPWLKFFTTDWRSDPRLRMCSPAARGLWIDMICIAHEAVPYGHVLVHGQTPNEAQLAFLTGTHVAEIPDLVAELERHGVFSRTKEGVIYSRKLVRMAAKSAKARKTGKLGGNPSLGKEREKQKSVNLDLKGRDNTQKPEARSQREEKEEPDGSSKKKASRIFPAWTLPPDWRDWATGQGLDEVSTAREADRFRDYWLAKAGRDGAKLDWQATWRNWVRKALEDRAGSPPGGVVKLGERRAIGGEECVWRGPGDGWVRVYR